MSEYNLSEFPGRDELLQWHAGAGTGDVPAVNAHLHSPYSFSAFEDMNQMFRLAVRENIKVLGINDFFVTDGYPSFYTHSLKHRIFPLFNIEFIGLLKEEQDRDIRVNDPNNPGRTYFCGKGLRYPFETTERIRCKLDNLKHESQLHIKEMIDRVNDLLSGVESGLSLKYSEIKRMFARELVRERHVARAIRELIFKRFSTEEERKGAFSNLFGGPAPEHLGSGDAPLEIEIRSRLLKAGGLAYVPEDEEAFLPVDEVIRIILKCGGIPCYPVLLDNAEGRYTEYESDMHILMNELRARKVPCIELIPGRNDLDLLRDFVMFFRKNGFVITFGTEHNTPELIPLKVSARNNRELDDELNLISWEGSCVIAAHQYLHAKDQEGYIDETGTAKSDRMEEFVILGKAVINYFLQSS